MNLVSFICINSLYTDMGTYEHMLEYYHGMCRDLCVKWALANWSEI